MTHQLIKINSIPLCVGIDDFIVIEYSNTEITKNIQMYLENVYDELRSYKYDLDISDKPNYNIIDVNNIDEWPSMPIPRPDHLIISIPNKDNDKNTTGFYDIIYLGEKYSRSTGEHDTHVIVIYIEKHNKYSNNYSFDFINEYNMIFTLDNKNYDIYFKSDEYNPVKYWEDIIRQ